MEKERPLFERLLSDMEPWRQVALQALEHTKNLTARPDLVSAWAQLASWWSVFESARNLAWTLGEFALQAKALADARDWESINASIDAIRDEVIDRGKALLDEFPNAIELIMSIEAVDELLDAIKEHESGPQRLQELLELIEHVADALIGRLIDLVLEPDTRETVQQTSQLFSRLDDLFQDIIEEIIIPRLIKQM